MFKLFLNLRRLIFCCLPLFMAGGCSTHWDMLNIPVQDGAASVPTTLNQRVKSLSLQPKTRQLYILLDQGPSMSEEYRGMSLQRYAKEILLRLRCSYPKLQFSEHIFIYTDDRSYAGIDAGNVTTLSSENFDAAINEIAASIPADAGSAALMVISRWENLESAALRQIGLAHDKLRYKPGLCLYPIGIGNRYSRSLVDEVDRCGFSVAGDSIAQPRNMSHYVERVLFYGPADSDGDGIYDYLDRCPDSAKGRLVRFDGCYRFDGAGER
jgi:hypothetical protein